ncbi:hypothetical protein LCGC14_0757040 [marine sediment metagenome]|uniref:Uncharacterized protein n=1 Tax=marine sediment metagenome TaxID=412755 RepID=A0A0F9Q6E8_9ZZZZ|nr:hypothetical protein [archaeon]
MNRKAEYEVFINLYKLALEFSKSNVLILSEMSHYLVDNLISKICIFVAQEKNLIYQTISRNGKEKTFNFPKLYKEILSPIYPNVPHYDKEIKKQHDQRNLFQHTSESITLGIRPEFAIEYVRLTEIILKEVGIIEEDKKVEPTNYLKAQYSKEKPNIEYLEESKGFANEEAIFNKLAKLEKDFDQNIISQKVKSDLDMRIIAYPLLNTGGLFKIPQISELKNYLEIEAINGPPIDSFPTQIFDNLSVTREGLQFISSSNLIGSILIQREGLILYNWRYGIKKDAHNETLPVHIMSAYVLGFLYLLSKFFNKLKYLGIIKIIFSVSNLSNWKYSPHPRFIYNRPKYNFLHSSFIPFERICTIKELGSKEGKHNLLQEIFNEILLSFGDSKGFGLGDNLTTFLEKN